MGNGEELCLLCDLALTRCGLRVAVEKKARNFATPGFFYPKSVIVGLWGGGLWPCRCIVNNCYYFRHPCFIRFLGSYSVTFMLGDVDIVRQMSPSKKNQCPVDVLDVDKIHVKSCGLSWPQNEIGKTQDFAEIPFGFRKYGNWVGFWLKISLWAIHVKVCMSHSPHWKLQNIPWATQHY